MPFQIRCVAGFHRIFLKAGECRKIEIPIWEKAFTVVDRTGKRMEEGKKFEIYAGCSQPDRKKQRTDRDHAGKDHLGKNNKKI